MAMTLFDATSRDVAQPPYFDTVTGSMQSISRLLQHLHYAFQPIVCMRSGRMFGLEALLRGCDAAGFPSVPAFFDHAWHSGTLAAIEAVLEERAIVAAADILRRTGSRLFFNLDNRNLDLRAKRSQPLLKLLKEQGLDASAVCLEISERHAMTDPAAAAATLKSLRHSGHTLALDDFGSGFSGLQILYEQQPDLIKIDRFFVRDLNRDERKRQFVSTFINLAHVLGIKVVAEGVETEEEFRAAGQVGCDLAQGYYIAHPCPDLSTVKEYYDIVANANRRERRGQSREQALMRDELVALPTLSVSDSMSSVFEAFRTQANASFLPVVDRNCYPVGVVFDKNIKTYTYSRFGKDLLLNKANNRGLNDFMSSALSCEITTDVDKVLAMYASSAEPAPILVTENFRYVGVLPPESLLKIINEKNITSARNQNPLTRLPGNIPVSDYILEALDDEENSYFMVYFDLDNFKPFNDTFGFRQGDRAILMFSDELRTTLQVSNVFIGHIGGDDFFTGFRNFDAPRMMELVRSVVTGFAHNILSFYDGETRERGYIKAKGRDGKPARFPLLSCSAAVLHLPAGPRRVTIDQITALIARAKKAAKLSADHVSFREVDQTETADSGDN